MLKALWEDDCGGVIATEYVLVATLLVIGLVAGLQALRLSMLAGLTNVAGAVTGVQDQIPPSLRHSTPPATAAGPAAANQLPID
jgi:Flp pilus assembly pilin Flp